MAGGPRPRRCSPVIRALACPQDVGPRRCTAESDRGLLGGVRVRDLLQGWLDLITAVAREAENRFGPLGPFSAEELAALVGQAFMGGEAMLLLGFDRHRWPVRSALRRFGFLIRGLEDGASDKSDPREW